MSAPPPDPALLHVATLITLPPEGVAALAMSPFGVFALHPCATAAEAMSLLDERHCDALILAADAPADAQALAAAVAVDVAVLVVSATLEADAAMQWQQRGAQDVLLQSDLVSGMFALRLRGAIQRKRIERDARTAYATDLETGLPHQQQFIEHVSQLLALREREPAPMAVLVLRIEGLASAEARLGRDAANALRRKVGVRLRAGVRASDVVASLGDDGFAVLLGSILSPADAVRVGAKLTAALLEPFKIAAQDVAVASALGIAQYPQDGAQPELLLRRAIGLAAATPAQGRAGFANFGEGDGASAVAANDD